MRLGMLGLWHVHAEGMVRQIAVHPGEFLLVGGYDADPALAEHRATRWTNILPGFRVFETAAALLAEKLDGVIIEGRVYENLNLAQQALESGRPVLLEKPAGDMPGDFERLHEFARARQLHVQMLYLFRSMPAVEELLARARRGELGEIYQFRGRLPKDPASYAEYVADLGRYRGGMFFEMAGHLVDLLATLLGKPATITPFLGHHAGTPGAFTDHGIAMFCYPRAWATIEVSALEAAPRTRRIEVYGTQGACIIPHLGSGHLANEAVQVIEVYQNGWPDWQRIERPARPLQIADLREFAAVVAGKKPPDYSSRHDLLVEQILLEASGMAS